MAPTRDVTEEARGPIKPSFPGFIVALLLAKSKPPEVTVRGNNYTPIMEMITTQLRVSSRLPWKLRCYIREDGRPGNDSTGARYIDTLTFWKDTHQRLQQELYEQRTRIYSLERELDASKGLESPAPAQENERREPPGTHSSSRGKKRKRGNTIVAGHETVTQTGDGMVRLSAADGLDTALHGPHGKTYHVPK